MSRLLSLGLVFFAVLVAGFSGCGKSAPPPSNEIFEPPKELDQMKEQMIKNFESNTVPKKTSK